MYKRITELSVIIGLFFIILAVILLGGYLLTDALKFRINIVTGVAFLAFGIFMVLVKSGEEGR
jgi:hypothetical protein